MAVAKAPTPFVEHLHQALVHLYDPTRLRASPLVGLLAVDPRQGARALRCILTEAIEGLKPNADTPPQARSWRIYRILFHRYTEQCTQREVWDMLGLSERQLRREEHRALQALADQLWIQHGVHLREAYEAGADGATGAEAEAIGAGTSSREQELAWLKRTPTGESADLAEELGAALRIVEPLLRALAVDVRLDLASSLPRLVIEPSPLRQALLNLLTAAANSVPGGEIAIAAEVAHGQVCVRVAPQRGPTCSAPLPADAVEKLDMARELVKLSQGSLEVGHPFAATLRLPPAEEAAVLFIDDNADTLRLYQRCLTGTVYPFIGTRDPEEALELAGDRPPQVIVLDLMLPGVDGWEVLGRLREHPSTRGIPVMVCSILPQEQLALTLGAAAFMRKPISRAALLAALERVVGRRP